MAISRIVIIHSAHDHERCYCLVRSLRSVGYSVWYNRWAWWQERISRRAAVLPEGDLYLLLLSTAAQSSEQWRKACQAVLAQDKYVIPLLYEAISIEGFLHLRQILNVSGLDCGNVARRVIAELERIDEERRLPPISNPETRVSPPEILVRRKTGYLSVLLSGIAILLLLILNTGDLQANQLLGQRPSISSPTIYMGSTNGNVYALDAASGAPLWQHWMGAEIATLNVVLANGTVYVSTGSNSVGNNGRVYALRARDGTEIWHHTFNDAIDFVIVYNSVVYAGSGYGAELPSDGPHYMYALQASSGKMLWQQSILGVIKSSSVILSSGTIYVATSADYLYALRADNEHIVWSHTFKGLFWGMAIEGDVIYASVGNKLCAWKASVGTQLWCYDAGGQTATAPVISGNTIYIGIVDGSIYALTLTGKRLWQYQSPIHDNDAAPTDIVVADGVVGLVIDDNTANGDMVYIYGLAESTETLNWSYQTTGPAIAPVISRGTIYIGSLGGIYAITLQTGALVWQFNDVTQPLSPHMVVSKGIIYFASYDTYFYALSTRNQLRWRYDAHGTVYSFVLNSA